MRKVMTRLILGLMCLGLCAWAVVWHHRSETKSEQAIQKQQDEAIAKVLAELRKKQEVIVGMVSAHNAVTDWTNAFGGERFTERLGIEELAPVLARKDRRPVLVFGSIVDVITQDDGCKLEVDAKANLVSNIRFWLACTPAQVKEAISHQEEALEASREELREETGGTGDETPEEKRKDEREAEQRARRWYAVIAYADTVRSEEAETSDNLSRKAQFTFAEGRCLGLI